MPVAHGSELYNTNEYKKMYVCHTFFFQRFDGRRPANAAAWAVTEKKDAEDASQAELRQWLTAWSPEKAAVLAAEAAKALGSTQDYRLHDLVALFGNLPEPVLDAAGLAQRLAKLKKLNTLPKPETMKQVFRLLQAIGERRCALTGTQKKKKKKKTPPSRRSGARLHQSRAKDRELQT